MNRKYPYKYVNRMIRFIKRKKGYIPNRFLAVSEVEKLYMKAKG
jgi:hypothetical protein